MIFFFHLQYQFNIRNKKNLKVTKYFSLVIYIYIYIYIGWNAKIVVLKKTTLQLYFKTFIEKINSGNLIMS